MNYNTDKPIESQKQDLLGRATFSKRLANAIYQYNADDGLVIGVFGKWGTGKTSILNMVIDEINCLSMDSDRKPIIVKFSPWNYSNYDNLINLFFRMLKNQLALDKGEETAKKLGQALVDYSNALDALSIVPILGSTLAAILKPIAQAQGNRLLKDIDLDTTKNNLEIALRDANQKIIVFIDDIDRLTNPQIRDIFQLVKSVGNFPNIIYVLSMDRDVVCSALKEVHNINGSEYLEKIIQIPFEVPTLTKSKLQEIFFMKLDNTVKSISENITWDQNYWSEVFTNCIEPYISSFRDVNRVLNTFQFRCEFLYKEITLEDLLAITTIEVLEPKLYQWIGQNKDLFCETSLHSLSSFYRKKDDYYKSICNELSKLAIDTDKAITFLSVIFPIFANDIDSHKARYVSVNNARESMRITHEKRFDLYFLFNLSSIPVPRYLLNQFIKEMKEDELISTIVDINQAGNIEYFIDELRSLVASIPDKRLALLASVILMHQYNFSSIQVGGSFLLPISSKANYLVIDIISKIDNENERYKVVKMNLENADINQFGAVSQLINNIELSYNRLTGRGETGFQIINLEHLELIEKTYILKVNEIVSADSLVNIGQFYLVLYLWKSFDEEGVRNFIGRLLENESGVLKFICAIARPWNGTSGNGWYFLEDDYSSYISKDIIYKYIQDFDKNHLNIFAREDQIKLASFVLNYDKSDRYESTEKDAEILVNEWRHIS